MKRICSILLTVTLLCGMCAMVAMPAGATNTEEPPVTEVNPATEESTTTDENITTDESSTPEETTVPEETEPEDTQMKASDELIALLKYEEGFCKYPVWDYSQYTVGYGTRCPSDMLSEYLRRGITEYEAELLLREHLANTEWLINTKLIEKYGLTMTQGQFDALVTFSYNMGPGWITSPSQNIHQQVVNGATGNVIIDALSRWCKAGGSVHNVLLRRRLSEARMYIEGVYSHSIPETYCYVLYNGNGGSTSQSAQGYNPEMPNAVPRCVATYGNYTFAGWYTSPSGGEKVEVLTQSLRGATLYAHWTEIEPEKPEILENPVTVTVTTDDVNLRKGPGTNYARIGSADEGDTFTITQIVESSNYVWGCYGNGWICLQYTNYNGADTPEPSEPEEDDPSDPTEPDASEPEVTVPDNTKPAPTEPEATEPDAEKPVTGKINADPFLRVRKGPGTGYDVVDTLQTGEKVVILQQKSVGSSVWGRIENGWISMSYVILDKTTEPENNPGGSQPIEGKTGTITCDLLNVRSGAGVNYGIVGHYNKNDTVTVTQQKTVGSTTWGKTAKGWVSMDYVSLKSESTGKPDNNQGSTSEITGTVTSDDVLRIRSGAGTSYGVVGFLNPGTKVTILERKTVGATTWGKIAKGWISMDYVKLDTNSGPNDLPPDEFEEEETSMVKTVTASCLLIRKSAGTNYGVVGYLYKGSKVTVTETKTVSGAVWGKIANGWICLDYTK